MLVYKVLSWIQSFSKTSYSTPERKKQINTVLKSMSNITKPEELSQSLFDELKYDIAIMSQPGIDVLTENVEEIYALNISSRSYRKMGMAKYLLKIITVVDFRTYLKVAVISHTNPKFYSTSWLSDDYLNLLDALASGDINFARKFTCEYMPDISLDYVAIYPEVTFRASMHMILRALVLEQNNFDAWVPLLTETLKYRPECYEKLPVIFESIVAKDNKTLEFCLMAFTIGHEEIFKLNKFGETSRGDVACKLSDEYLFVWAVALLNLARSKGMNVSITHHLVPQELLSPVSC